MNFYLVGYTPNVSVELTADNTVFARNKVDAIQAYYDKMGVYLSKGKCRQLIQRQNITVACINEVL
jgi:hypothetical protein